MGVGQGAVEGLVSLRDRPVLVTGHTGFKGGWLSLWLATLGARVHGYALAPPTHPNLFDVAGVARVLASDTRADLADLAALTATFERFRPEIVFHLAAQPLVREGYRDPLGTLATNVTGTAHVLEATRAVDSVRAVVVVATYKVYQNVETGHAFSEVDPLGGHDPYSGSKAAAEIAVASYRSSFFGPGRHPARIATARAGNVIGGGDWAADRLVPDCLRAFATGEPVRLRHPEAVRPWQHVLGPLSGYLGLAARLLDEDGEPLARAWNFGPDADDDATVGDVTDGRVVAGGRTEVPGPCQPLAVLVKQSPRELQVPRQRSEHVLPGPDGLRMAQADRLPGRERAEAIGHEAVRGPIAAADDVAGPGGRDPGGMASVPEEARAVAGDGDLGGRLAPAVRIVAAERVGLAEGVARLHVPVDLVGRDDDHGPHGVHRTGRLEEVGRAHDVRRERAERILVALPHEGLGGEVEDDLGPESLERGGHCGEVGEVRPGVGCQYPVDPGDIEEIRLRGRRQGVSVHARPDPNVLEELETVIRRAGLDIVSTQHRREDPDLVVDFELRGPRRLHDVAMLALLRQPGVRTVSSGE